jgi:hypothetical protein
MEAFKRNAEVDANRIQVETNGSEVILKGSVVHGSSAKKPSGSPGRRQVSPKWKTGWSWPPERPTVAR